MRKSPSCVFPAGVYAAPRGVQFSAVAPAAFTLQNREKLSLSKFELTQTKFKLTPC